MNKNTFSRRKGYHSTHEVNITVREDAPHDLRGIIRMIFYELGEKPSKLRKIVCRVLQIPPDGDNWSEYPNIDEEVRGLLERCDWFFVYDIIETIISNLSSNEKETFVSAINDYFISNGIGWKIVNGLIETRGNEIFETAIEKVENVLETAKLQTAKTEIKEAILDLSRRPHPDITGAIQHSLACLECVVREVSADKKSTLGELMKKYSTVIPSPLDMAISKLWGYTSEQGRHLKEGNAPNYIEAELVVGITAVISTYLGGKLQNIDDKTEMIEDFPF